MIMAYSWFCGQTSLLAGFGRLSGDGTRDTIQVGLAQGKCPTHCTITQNLVGSGIFEHQVAPYEFYKCIHKASKS